MRFLLILLAFFAPSAFAADAGLIPTLAPPPGDLSVSQLANIFGIVDGVLHGTGSQILGTMFGVYNAAILTMGTIILTYLFVVGTLNTAHEGEIMGKKWSSIWIPLRSAAGIALLLPKATGYSFIQIMVMWVVVQGVGAADLVWSKALDYLGRGGLVVQATQVFGPTLMDIDVTGLRGTGYQAGTKDNPRKPEDTPTVNKSAFLIPIAGSILKQEVCMYALRNALINAYPDKQIPPANPGLAKRLEVSGMLPGAVQEFPGPMNVPGLGNYEGICGKLTWAPAGDDLKVPVNYGFSDSRTVAVQQMVLDLQPQAQQIANALIPTTQGRQPTAPSFVKNDLFYATADYMGIMGPWLRQQAGNVDQKKLKFVEEAKGVGWILAGAYYYDMARLDSTKTGEESLNAIKSGISDVACQPGSTNRACSVPGLSKVNYLVSGGEPKCAVVNAKSSAIDQYICSEYNNNINAERSRGQNMLNPNKPETSRTSVNIPELKDQPNEIIRAIAGEFFNMYEDLRNAQSQGKDPILQVAAIGMVLINGVEQVWVYGGLAIFTITTLVGITVLGSGAGAAQGIIAFLAWLLPLVGTVLLALFVSGLTMAYYVPLIPFILFVFGAMTWFATVLEAIVAAPLVALGLAHPEGHEHLGQAQYAVMLLANVFLRPVLMIFGFIGGAIIANVAVWVLNLGFGRAWMGAQSDWLFSMAYMVATIVIYVTLVLIIINRAFALIYEVPNKVIRWVGGAAESTGEGQALEEVRGAATRGAETTGGVAQKAVEGAATGPGEFIAKQKQPKSGTDVEVS